MRLLIILTLLCVYSSAHATWQETLEQNFNFVDTFNHYDDWLVLDQASDLPVYTIGGGHSPYMGDTPIVVYNDSTITPALRPLVIDDRDSYKSVDSSKSVRLNWAGNGEGQQEAAGFKWYFGDGTEDGGIKDLYVFFATRMPSDLLVTDVALSQDTANSMHGADKKDGDTLLQQVSAKFVAISMGFVSPDSWSDDIIDTSDCRWGWSENHLFLSWVNYSGVPVVRSANPDGTSYNGDVSVLPWLDKLIYVQIHIKREAVVGGSDGSINVKFFDADGSNETTMLDQTGISLLLTDGACEGSSGVTEARANTMGYDRLSFYGNHRVDASPIGGASDVYYRCGDYYDTNGDYVRPLDCSVYVDDIIAAPAEIATTYFSLKSLGESPPYNFGWTIGD